MTERDVTHTVDTLPLARLPSGRQVEATLHRYEGDASGPTVYLQALQHGGEVNGAAVLRELHEWLLAGDLAGTVLAVPVANPLAFDHRVYLAPNRLDAINSNMNRLWPGDPDGTLMERMVDRLWEHAVDADAIVDLHTSGPDLWTHTRFTEGHEASRELAAAFGIDPIVADGGTAAERGKLREVAAAEGVPTITPELAHSREIVPESVRKGVKGLENVLATVGAVDRHADTHDPSVYRDKKPIHTAESGLFRSAACSVGDRVEPGETVGEVFDPSTYETLQVIEANRDGRLLSLNRGSTVMEGESIGMTVVGE